MTKQPDLTDIATQETDTNFYPPMMVDEAAEVEEVWQKHWLPLVAVNGQVDIERIKRELFDYAYLLDQERLFQEAIEEAQQPMTEDQSKLAVKNIADAARAFLQCYDEFEPEQHGSCGEYLDALFDACDEFGKIDGTADIEQKET